MRYHLSRSCLLLAPMLFFGCAKPPAPPSVAAPSRVTVARAERKTVPIEANAVGTVKVVATVTLRPRVGGELTEVHFKEGDYIKKGQKLFTIDPRPYQAAVTQAEANLNKDRAVLRGAELDLARAERSGSTRAVAQIEVDSARTAVASSRASVDANEAALNSAKLQLSFTTIYSPIDGRTGGWLVTPGNLLNAMDQNPLVVINQVSPIHVAFSLPEQQLPAVAAARRKAPLRAEAHLRDGEPPIVGTLSFIDNAVDTTTGTVQLKAEFPNEDRKLWPGQFINIVLTVGERPDSVVVPSAAVQAGQQGSYVFIVDGEGKAAIRPVTVAFDRAGESIIATGLDGTELVVTEGQLRIAPGSKVEVRTASDNPSTESHARAK